VREVQAGGLQGGGGAQQVRAAGCRGEEATGVGQG
jgi:hypothetical protein